MHDSIKNYWKLGKDKYGDTLWMQKPRLCPNGYWEVALVFHYTKGCRPGKGDSRFCSIIANELMSAPSAIFKGLMPDDKRLQFVEIIRAIVIASRYSWMLKRGDTTLAHVPGEELVLNGQRFNTTGSVNPSSHEIRRIDCFIIPNLVKLVDKMFKQPTV
jgi:hypothetical protein